MANFSSTYPATKPVFQADFANGGRIDPRATFSRADTASSGDWNASTNAPGLADGSGTANQYYRVSVAGTQNLGSGSITYAVGDYVKYSGSVWYKTTQPIGVTYWSNEKHLSSENVLTYSSTFDNPVWLGGGASRTGGQTDPAGGSNAYTLLEDTTSTYHNAYQNFSGNESWALTVYGKQNTGSRYLQLRLYGGSANNYETAVFDLAGSAPSTASGSSSGFTNVSATQTASGNGFYKCTLKGTGSITFVAIHISQNSTATGLDAYGVAPYTGDNTSSIDLAFASLSTTGSTDYNATTTQIHREYAPSLKYVTPATGGMARFEYDPTDGQSEGILVESQSTNLLNYSEQFDNAYWTKYRATIKANAAIAPSGELTADLFVAEQTGSSQTHIVQSASQAYTSGTAYTFSIFVKPAGFSKIRISAANTLTWAAAADYDLSGSGSVSGVTGTASAAAVGNGWFRCSLTGTAGATASTPTYVFLDNGSGTSFDGDDYSGVIIWGAMHEQASHSSSYLKVEGSTATRAADSLSVDLSAINQDPIGTDIALATEFRCNVVDTTFRRIAEMRMSSGSGLHKSHVIYNGYAYSYATDTSDVNQTLKSIANLGDTSHKLVSTQSGASAFAAGDGVAGNTKTSTAEDMVYDRLYIGSDGAGIRQLDGHISRVALYGNSVSETNATALSS